MGLNGLDELKRSLGDLKQNLDTYPDEAVENVIDGQHGDATADARATIQMQGTVAHGHLIGGFVHKREEIPSGRRHIWENEAPHSVLVEFGTGDQWRPNPYTDRFEAPDYGPRLVEAIRRWITAKPTVFPKHGLEESARLISLSIAGYINGHPSGTPPQPFFEPAWFRNKPNLEQRLDNAVKKAVRRA